MINYWNKKIPTFCHKIYKLSCISFILSFISPITIKEDWFPQYLATQALYVWGISGSKPLHLALVSLQMHFIYSFWNTFATCKLPRKFLSFQLKYYFLWFDYNIKSWIKSLSHAELYNRTFYNDGNVPYLYYPIGWLLAKCGYWALEI